MGYDLFGLQNYGECTEKKERKKKNLLISSQPTGRVSEYRFFIFVTMISSVFAIRGPSDTAICKQFVFSIDRSRLHFNINVKTPRIVLIFQSSNSKFIMGIHERKLLLKGI